MMFLSPKQRLCHFSSQSLQDCFLSLMTYAKSARQRESQCLPEIRWKKRRTNHSGNFTAALEGGLEWRDRGTCTGECTGMSSRSRCFRNRMVPLTCDVDSMQDLRGGLIGTIGEYALECLADLGLSLCGIKAGGQQGDWTVGGVGIELWITLLVGIATVCTAVMGPCFAKALSKRWERKKARRRAERQAGGRRQDAVQVDEGQKCCADVSKLDDGVRGQQGAVDGPI